MDIDEDILRHMGMLHAGVQRAAPLNNVNVSEMVLPMDGVQCIHDRARDATQGTKLTNPFNADERGPPNHSLHQADRYGFTLRSTTVEPHHKRGVTLTRYRFGRDSMLNRSGDGYEVAQFYEMTSSLADRLRQLEALQEQRMEWGFRVVVKANESDMAVVSSSFFDHETLGVRGVTRTGNIDELVAHVRESIEATLSRDEGTESDAFSLTDYEVLNNQYEVTMIPARVGGGNDNMDLLMFTEVKARTHRTARVLDSWFYRVHDLGGGKDGDSCALLVSQKAFGVRRFNAQATRQEVGLAPGKVALESLPLLFAHMAHHTNQRARYRVITPEPTIHRELKVAEESENGFQRRRYKGDEFQYRVITTWSDNVIAEGVVGNEDAPLVEFTVMYHDVEQHFTLVHGRLSPYFDPYSGILVGHKNNVHPSHGERIAALKDLGAKVGKRKRKRRLAQTQDTHFLGYDVETVFDTHTGKLMVYSYCWQLYSPERQLVKEKYCRIGEKVGALDCMHAFFEDLAGLDKSVERVLLVAYNGSSFENFHLAGYLSSTNVDRGFAPFYAGNKLLNMKFSVPRGGGVAPLHVTTWDPCRFTMSSLANACKNFDTKTKKIEGFSHVEVQKVFERDRLDEWLQRNDAKLREYNMTDVQCMMELCWKLFDVVLDIFDSKRADGRLMDKPLYRYSTIASWAKTMWKKLLHVRLEEEWGDIQTAKEKNQYPDIPQDYETWCFIRRAAFGGRAQAFRKGVFEGHWQIQDIVSLYPFVMLFRHFPVGREIKTTHYVENILGVYNCRIHFQLPAKPNVIPRRSDDKPLDWTFKGGMDCVLCTVDIEDLRKHHGHDSVTVLDGVYWPETSDKLFSDYLTPLKTVKQQQDVYKSSKDPLYNPSLRSMAKLGSNSLSGKVIELMRAVINFVVAGAKQRRETESKYGTVRFRRMSDRPGVFLATVYKNEEELAGEKRTKVLHPANLVSSFTHTPAVTCTIQQSLDVRVALVWTLTHFLSRWMTCQCCSNSILTCTVRNMVSMTWRWKRHTMVRDLSTTRARRKRSLCWHPNATEWWTCKARLPSRHASRESAGMSVC